MFKLWYENFQQFPSKLDTKHHYCVYKLGISCNLSHGTMQKTTIL